LTGRKNAATADGQAGAMRFLFCLALVLLSASVLVVEAAAFVL
jgi:hypothetical protein